MHPLAYEIASSLPFHTIASLCKDHSRSPVTSGHEPEPKRLIFVGHSMSGVVAHTAAVLARENASLQQAQVDVGAIAFGSPHGLSIGITEALQRSGLDKLHLTYCHPGDVMLRIYQLALDVQVARTATNDSVFDAASLVEHVQHLQSHQASEVSMGWDAVQSSEREALDMLESHFHTARHKQFVPVGTFAWTVDRETVDCDDDPFSIQERISTIPLRQSDLRLHKILPTVPTKDVHFSRTSSHIEDLTPQLRPVISQCGFLASPGNEAQSIPSKIDIRICGRHLENVIQRNVSGHVSVDYSTEPSVGSVSPLCIHDRNGVVTSPSSFILVSSTCDSEAKLSLSNASVADDVMEVPVTLRNDFGESEVFRASVHTIDKKDMPTLQVFSSFNSEILMTSFSRSLLLIYAAPSYYLTADGKQIRDDRIPPSLQYLCEIECLFLQTEESQLRAIVDSYCADPRMLNVAIHAARTEVNKVISVLLLPLQFKCDGKLKQLTKKVVGGLGTVVGGAITLVGGTLAIPGILMALVPLIGAFATSSNSASTAWTVAAVPGMLLSLPGIGICGLGSWLAVRSWRATRDKPTLQYSQILRFALECLLYGNADQVLDEVPALEESVINQFQTWASIQSDDSNLWNVTDEHLHELLSKPPAENVQPLYTAIKDVDQEKLRSWMRAIGRIYRMRQLMESFLVIGFVGVHNAGKSTWIRRLFDLDVMADGIQRTESVDLHPIRLSDDSEAAQQWLTHNPSSIKLGVVDFPGTSDEREAIALLSERLAHVTTLFVCVFRFGHIARAEKEVIDMVKRSERDFVVLINQCDIADDLQVRESEYRSNYASVLEIDPSLIHFVTAMDSPLDVERVRHLLWGHLQLLVHQDKDVFQLAMNLLPPALQDEIISHLPEDPAAVPAYLQERAVNPFLQSRADGEELFQHQELFLNLPLITRWQPVNTLTTGYDNYPSPEIWRRMEFLERASLFREHTPIPNSIIGCTMLQMEGKEAYESLQAGLMAIPKRDLRKGIRIQLLNDKAIDAGGPIRAVFREAAKHAQDGKVKFLRTYDNHSVYFNPAAVGESADLYRALGRMLGIAILQGLTFPANFSLPVFKLILGQPLSFQDYEALDRQDAQSILQICQMELEDVEMLSLTFSATYQEAGETKEVDLVQGGREIDVTQSNLTEYLRTYVLYRLGTHLPLKSFVLGVQDVVPRDKLCLFSPQMLQLLVNGIQDYSVDELRSECNITGVPDQVRDWFWKALHEMTANDRALFLTFVTGTSVLPAAGLDPPLQIKAGKGTLPKSHTCFNTLELPIYESEEQLNANLLFAIRNADTMDFGMI